MSISEDIISARLKSIRRTMRGKGIDWLVLTSTANVTFTTGFMGEDSWALVGLRKSYLITDSRYTEEALRDCAGCDVIERKEGIIKVVVVLIGKGRGSIGVDDAMTVAFHEALQKAMKGRLKRAGRLTEDARQVKDDGEVKLIRKAAQIAWDALGAALVLRAGMTESELAGRIEFEMRKFSARPSFDTIVAFGANASQAHYRPGNRKLQKNDTILIDFGVKWKGYCCDITRCFAVGKVGAQYLRAYQVVLDAHTRAVAMVKAGAQIKQIDEAARKVITESGLPAYNHGLGHGLGLEVHEGPVVSLRAEAVLKPGQVITIEPGVYIPGRLGVRLENDYLVTDEGCRLLSGGSQRFALGPVPVLPIR